MRMKIRRVLLHFFPRYAVGRMVIYGKLMRIDKPIGTLLLLWPTYWALWVASEGIPEADIFGRLPPVRSLCAAQAA